MLTHAFLTLQMRMLRSGTIGREDFQRVCRMQRLSFRGTHKMRLVNEGKAWTYQNRCVLGDFVQEYDSDSDSD